MKIFSILKSIILLSSFLSILNAEVITNKKVITSMGEGTGTTRAESINNAIIEALGKIEGVEISKKTKMESLYVETSEGASAKLKYNGEISKITGGKVDSYQINYVNKDSEGLYNAQVEITKNKVTKIYRTPGIPPKNRRAIAIVPSYANQASYSILGDIKSASDASLKMTQELVSAITKTRKFTVLDREANSAYRNEKRVLTSNDASTDELLKLGQVLGADYLLVSNLTELSVSKNNATAAIVANMKDSYKAYATIQYRIIAMATRQIKWSNTMSLEFEPNGNTIEQLYLNTLKLISQRVTTELMENIYPLKIVDVDAKKITINQGSLTVGQEYDVYRLGKKIYDSYTKESLGRSEEKVGKIKIVRTIPKMSIAEVIKGDVSKGDICRTSTRSNSSTYFDNPTEADYGGIQIKDGGGVVLPFD